MALGYFSEQSFPFQGDDYLRIASCPSDGSSARRWLVEAHETLSPLLPDDSAPALLTDQLVGPGGNPVDVFAHFGVNPARLASLRHNFAGLSQTARAAGASRAPDAPIAPWANFDDVWIPVADGVELSARFGRARPADESGEADCIVILPGLFGDNSILRTRDLAVALCANGFDALALEFRGHGESLRARRDLFYNFGILESADLLAVSRWLQDRQGVRRTGLVGFCWGANHALMAAWYDVRPEPHVSVTDKLAAYLPPAVPRCHYEAGVMALSPVLNFERLINDLDQPWSSFRHPVNSGLQKTIKTRMAFRGFESPNGSLRRLVDEEFARSPVNYPGVASDVNRLMRLLPFEGEPDGSKLDDLRVPTLIVHAANDPMSPAQDVALLASRVRNPLVAAAVLPGGGHVGFAAYARAYYYSLIMNYFDPIVGAAATRDSPARTAASAPAAASS
jgi:predicted alpha/beta-fold hydrolase